MEVSIAFRRSPRSRPSATPSPSNLKSLGVSIAFRRSPRSRRILELGGFVGVVACVSIAFRRSPRSRHGNGKLLEKEEIHVSIAFRRSPRSRPTKFFLSLDAMPFRLHCLSAFTTFATGGWPAEAGECGSRSPLPFGVHHVRDAARWVVAWTISARSPLPFGVHHVRDSQSFGHLWRMRMLSPLPFGVHHVRDRLSRPRTSWPGSVSIAFRRSPRSRLPAHASVPAALLESPLPFGVHHVRDSRASSMSCIAG